MSDVDIRPAAASDVPAIRAVVADAYGHYVERMGRTPAPMTANYEQIVGDGTMLVLTVGGVVAGLTVLKMGADHLLVSNVAVASAYQGRGFGRSLLDHAEMRASREGIGELRLFTNELMHENVAIYTKLGWEEYGRAEQDGFRRVFMRKRIARPERRP